MTHIHWTRRAGLALIAGALLAAKAAAQGTTTVTRADLAWRYLLMDARYAAADSAERLTDSTRAALNRIFDRSTLSFFGGRLAMTATMMDTAITLADPAYRYERRTVPAGVMIDGRPARSVRESLQAISPRMLPSLAILASALLSPQLAAQEVIVCGADELFILDIATPTPRKVWSWRARDRSELPDAMRRKFQTIAECKPADDGRRLLIASSSNGAAVIDRATGRVEFYATAMNGHSIELLPGDRVVIAASHVANGTGDRLSVYDLRQSDVELFHVDTPWPHAVIWDAERQLLWADSQKDVVGYRLTDWGTATPRLTPEVVAPLPDINGHDMMPVPDSPLLILSTAAHTWFFDRTSHRFTKHPLLGDVGKVKSVHIDPASKRLLWIQGEGTTWWSDMLHLRDPEATITLPGEKVYKVRWMPTSHAIPRSR